MNDHLTDIGPRVIQAAHAIVLRALDGAHWAAHAGDRPIDGNPSPRCGSPIEIRDGRAEQISTRKDAT